VPINEPRKLFAHKLGTALSAEKKVLTMLKKLEREATRDQLKRQFSHHRQETEGQIRNIEQAFQALGEKPTGHASPTFQGLAEQSDQLVGKVDETLVDTVLLGGAAETEHLEIAMYEGLITHAEAMGEDDIVALLQENLEQEKHTLEEVERATEALARQQARGAITV
jgi:ferritin-like metal-binding protein YciE